MGLSITAFRKGRLVTGIDAYEPDGSPRDEVIVLRENVDDTFKGREEGIEIGAYWVEQEDGMVFHVGPCSSYGDWREMLARLAGYAAHPNPPGLSPSGADRAHSWTAWEAKEGPFWELINFSDCEGTIGPVAAAKLARDFAEWQVRMYSASLSETGPDFLDHYGRFRRAFDLAAEGGAVTFH